jgi:hypothetical protein
MIAFVAHARLRAASALVPTLGPKTLPTDDGVEISLDTARRSACATGAK